MNRHRLIRALPGSGVIVLLIITLYLFLLNTLGPSTEYHDPYITSAKTGADDVYYAYIGDRVYVNYTIIRHAINGNCLLHVFRIGEEIGGPNDGKRHLLDYADLQFQGQNELRHAHWPLAGLVLGYDVNRKDEPQKDKPLLAPGVDEQRFALYVVARYLCNPLDYIMRRYLQGGTKPNETERVLLDVKRAR